jgi:hypothetical protein
MHMFGTGDVVPFSITSHALIALAVSAVTPCPPLSGSSAPYRCSTGCHPPPTRYKRSVPSASSPWSRQTHTTQRCDPPPGRYIHVCAKGRSLVALLEMHHPLCCSSLVARNTRTPLPHTTQRCNPPPGRYIHVAQKVAPSSPWRCTTFPHFVAASAVTLCSSLVARNTPTDIP